MRFRIVLLLLFCSLGAQAQFNYMERYMSLWREWGKNRTDATLKILEEISANALKEKDDSRLLEALFWRLDHAGYIPDRVQPGEIVTNQQMMYLSPGVRAMLYSIQGGRLFQYMLNQRDKVLKQTAIANDHHPDVRTWDATRFVKEITAAYDASLKDAALIKDMGIYRFGNVINAYGSIHTSLYEFLTLRALAYFQSGENTFTQAADKFEMEDTIAYADAAVFAAHHFAAPDTADLQFRAVLLLQDLLRYNEHKSRAAYLDIDLKRVEYMQQIALMPDKEELYVALLERMLRQYANEAEVTQVYYYLANYYNDRGDKKKAIALCEEGYNKRPGTVGASNCKALHYGIHFKVLNAQAEVVNIPGEPFKALVNYRNVNKLYLRVARLDSTMRMTLSAQEVREEGTWKQLLAAPVVRTWEVSLPAADDHFDHHAEIMIDALPTGYYVVLGSVTPDFAWQENLLFAQLTLISNLSYVENNGAFYVLNRKTGAPVPGVTVQEWEHGDGDTIVQTALSGKDGIAVMKKSGSGYRREYSYVFIHGKDTLALGIGEDDGHRSSYYNERAPDQTYLFTDRAIYRPGQTVYYKGIVLKPAGSDMADRSVHAGVKQTVSFSDANRTEIGRQEVETNAYGSYAGSFRIPEGKMNGEFRIDAGYSYLYIHVEEYKRPRFYIAFDSLKGSYQLNDTIIVKGKALAYAGHQIDGAKVKYRVKREARYPYWWLYRNTGSAARQITQGVTTTAADGSFSVRFPAWPDKHIAPADRPVFTYTIEADITDLNGETRSGNKSVQIGYHTMEIGIALNSRVVEKDLRQVRINTTNLNGVFEPAAVHVSLYPLHHPGRLFRKRYWNKPDQYTMSKEAYEKAFPLDVYNDEDDPATWRKEQAVWSKTWTTKQDSSIRLYDRSLAPGWYELTVDATDQYGQPVLQRKVFEVVDPGATRLSYPVYSWSYDEGKPLQPGQTSHFLLGTADSAYVVGLGSMTGLSDLAYRVTEQDRGDKLLQYVYVKDNRIVHVNRRIHVPWSNKELQMTVRSHRDKTLPGAKEEWQVHISGAKGDKAPAELLATMFDASLDSLKTHAWDIPDLYPYRDRIRGWRSGDNFMQVEGPAIYKITDKVDHRARTNISFPEMRYTEKHSNAILSFSDSNGLQPVTVIDYAPSGHWRTVNQVSYSASGAPARRSKKGVADNVTVGSLTQIQVRKDFNERVFFLPDLTTNKHGDITFSFTMPEALTRCRFMGLAHTKDARFAYTESNVVTQQTLMVLPEVPRFVREGDQVVFAAKISSVADHALSGEAQITLLDAIDQKPVHTFSQHFDLQSGQSTAISYAVKIPTAHTQPLLYRVVAKAGNYSDGEEHMIPVLPNRMLVTESLPMPMRGDGNKQFSFEKLLHSDSSHTLQQHALTVEYTANPAWYAVQALPYLMEYPYECSEQLFNRYYANTLAGYVVSSQPGIAQTFKKWQRAGAGALQSNLDKNEELKNVLKEQAPWVLEARGETAQKQQIARLFDEQGLRAMQQAALEKLRLRQGDDGGIGWFYGMQQNPFITQYILTGIAHLQQLGALKDDPTKAAAVEILDKGIGFADRYIADWYSNLKQQKVDMNRMQIGPLQAYYLYMRTVVNKPMGSRYNEVYFYLLRQATSYWREMDIYNQALLAIALGDKEIIASLKGRASNTAEMGMYWKEVAAGMMWWQSPIETQALLIEAFDKVTHDSVSVADMKTWLLKHKQTNNWGTTKATADACYAMLLGGSDWLAADPSVVVELGNTTVREKGEAGSGYFKKRFDSVAVQPDMGKININVSGSKGQPSWGAVYWQYFEQLDKITPAATPMIVEKQLYVASTDKNGEVMTAIQDGSQLKVGDKVKSRIILRVDRAMDYVHLKDMRAACFEPVDVLSKVDIQNGVWYFQTTKDVCTDFFFDHLNEGLYVFEYSLFVTNAGDFSNGITTAQCMYAPEFSAHSEGVRVKVSE